jgi:uncharacterized cupredoxin-like copper-binding protein
MREMKSILLSVTLAATSLLVCACGGGTTVTVELYEWKIVPSVTSAPAGEVTFVGDNKGMDKHELVLLKTDLAPDKLPLDAMGDVVEAGMGVAAVAEVEDIAPGKTGEFTADLKVGNYVLICNLAEPEGTMIEHHYALGMRSAFKVVE